MTEQTLSRLRAIDLGGPAAGIAARWLAAFGADVLRVEPPDGDWTRRYNPLGDEADPRGRGALQRYLDAGKRSIQLDLDSDAGRDRLQGLLAQADLVLHGSTPDQRRALGLDGEGVPPQNERLVEVWMPALPPEGPYAGFGAAPVVLLALGGYQFLTGQPGREPLALPGFQPDYLTGMYGIVAALAGIMAREGRSGDSYRISQLEALASAHQFTTTMWTQQGIIRSRHGNRWENLHPNTMLPCRDGWLSMAITTQEQWERLATMMGRPDLITDERFDTHPHRHANADLLDEIMVEWMMQFDKRELFERGQEEWRLPVGPLLDLQEILEEPQYRMRSFFVRPEGESDVLHPGLPVHMSRSEWRIRRSPAPGEGGGQPWMAHDRFEMPSPPAAVDAQHPLAGVRILDFTRVWSGPLAARVLADLGAEVIKVEAPLPEGYFARNQTAPAGAGPRRFMRAGNYQKLNRNRLGVCIDLRQEAGRDIVRRLASKSDMLIENFSARVMPNFGLGYDELSKENPGLVMLSMPGFGAKGPYRDYIAYGPAIEPMTGLSVLLGYPGEEPRTSAIAYPDAVAALNAAAAAMVALAEQRRTGFGQHIDLSQTEASVDFLGEYLVAYQETGGQRAPRIGNRHPHWAPQGTYRCIGDDEWVSIAVRSDNEWQALCAVAGLDGLVKDPRFSTVSGRRALLDDIDRAIAHWTEHRTKHEVMELLQAAGVPAGAVLNGRELVEDPQLAADGFFIEVEKEGDSYPMPGTPVVVNRARRGDWLAAPTPGEHNRLVLSSLLGLSDAEIDALDAEGVLGPTMRAGKA